MRNGSFLRSFCIGLSVYLPIISFAQQHSPFMATYELLKAGEVDFARSYLASVDLLTDKSDPLEKIHVNLMRAVVEALAHKFSKSHEHIAHAQDLLKTSVQGYYENIIIERMKTAIDLVAFDVRQMELKQ